MDYFQELPDALLRAIMRKAVSSSPRAASGYSGTALPLVCRRFRDIVLGLATRATVSEEAPLLKLGADLQSLSFGWECKLDGAALTHLTRLTRLGFGGAPWQLPCEALRVLSRLSELRALRDLDLRRMPLSDSVLRRDVCGLSQLTELNLSSQLDLKRGGGGLRAVSVLRGLRGLSVRDATVQELPYLPRLAALTVSAWFLGERNAHSLRRLPSLRSLTAFFSGMRRSEIADAVAQVGQLTGLTRLCLHGRWGMDSNCAALSRLAALRQLDVSQDFGDAGLRSMGMLTALTDLSLMCWYVADRGVYDGGLAPLQRLGQARRLALDAGLGRLHAGALYMEALTALTCLRIGLRAHLSASTWGSVAALGRLERLELEAELGSRVFEHTAPSSISALSALTALECLSFSNDAPPPALLDALAPLPALQCLRLHCCRLDDAQIAAMGALVQLRCLEILGPATSMVTDRGVSQLSRLCRLRTLRLSIASHIGSAAAMRGLCAIGTLTRLEFAKCTGICSWCITYVLRYASSTLVKLGVPNRASLMWSVAAGQRERTPPLHVELLVADLSDEQDAAV